jgi:hypothetical protein
MNLSRPLSLTVALAALAGAVTIATGTAAAADTRSDITWQATIDGRDIVTATSNSPVPLHARQDATVSLTVNNHGTEPVEIRAVRLDGRVLGMSFFTFSTRIDLAVPPGTTQKRVIILDLGELGDQATGLIPGTLSLVGQDRTVILQRPVTTDVRGSLLSPYGAFGVIVGAVTLVLALSLAWEIARRRLPLNRWRRGVRFLAPGLGLGLSATFTLSATRVLNPSASVWVPLVLTSGAAAFVVGYLTPTTHDDTDHNTDDLPAGPQVRLYLAGSEQLREREPAPAVEPASQTAVLELPHTDDTPSLPSPDLTTLQDGETAYDPHPHRR